MLFCEETYVGECSGSMEERDKKHYRDFLAGDRSWFYTRLGILGYGNFIAIPIIATGTCAPLRADRVLLEVQVMRLLCSSLNTRGFATVGTFDATHTASAADVLLPGRPRQRPVMRLRGAAPRTPRKMVDELVMPQGVEMGAGMEQTQHAKALMRYS